MLQCKIKTKKKQQQPLIKEKFNHKGTFSWQFQQFAFPSGLSQYCIVCLFDFVLFFFLQIPLDSSLWESLIANTLLDHF